MKYSARVVTGMGEGRKMGFPTLNLEIPEGFTARYGVYAGRVWLGGTAMPAAMHYGPVPVFKVKTPTLEAHVIDATIPQAPTELSFELLDYIREIRDFEGVEALAAQLREDVDAARRLLS